MTENEEAFLYPKINEKLCINCRACRKVCPMANKVEKSDLIQIYATQNKNDKQLKNSSSGGMFIIFAEYIIDEKGIVFGSTYDYDFKAYQTSAQTYNELLPMQGSKYVNSDTFNSYIKTKEYLEKDIKVLYTGTPCQIAGLKLYLKKEYPNLFTIDFLCHGVPSPKIFKTYIRSLETKRKGKLKTYNFRDKGKKGWGLVAGYVVERKGKIKKYYESGKLNSYLYGFTKGYFNRTSCYQCPFKGKNYPADITMADYWGVQKYHPHINSEKGVSILIVNSKKGEFFLENIKSKMLIEPTTINHAASENEGLKEIQEKHHIPYIRDEIYKLLDIEPYNAIRKKYLRPKGYMLLWIIDKMPIQLIRIVKKSLGKLFFR